VVSARSRGDTGIGEASDMTPILEGYPFNRNNVIIDVPFGAQDSELKGWEYTIPEGMEAEMKDGKIIVRQKESEDERIRKEINTLYSEIDTCISELLKARIDKDSEAEGKALFKMEGLMVATLQDLSCIEDYLEKQKEQKPAEGDYETEIQKAFREGKSAGRKEVFDHPEEYGLQKPAEWSEEDEKMIERLITRLNWITYNTRTDGTSPNITFFDEIEWLKSLRPPQYCENCRLKKSVQGWKPSEEQIYSLGTVVKGYNECTVGSVGYNLKELYEQLKKL
jgi:hypothetical protein